MFARHSKPTIMHAAALIEEAAAIAESYRRDNSYTPNNEDLRQFNALLDALWLSRCNLEHIVRGLYGRRKV